MISTKTGDGGQTTWRTIRVNKTSPEIQMLSLFDRAIAETASARVLARTQGASDMLQDQLARISRILSDVCAMLAANAARDILTDLIWCDKITMNFELHEFVDFGTRSQLAAAINLARTSVRCAETALIDACDEQDPLIRPLVNRLSDVLFVLAAQA